MIISKTLLRAIFLDCLFLGLLCMHRDNLLWRWWYVSGTTNQWILNIWFLLIWSDNTCPLEWFGSGLNLFGKPRGFISLKRWVVLSLYLIVTSLINVLFLVICQTAQRLWYSFSLNSTHAHAEALHLVLPNLVSCRLSSFKSHHASRHKGTVMFIRLAFQQNLK